MWGSCQGRCFFASSLIFIIGRSRSPCQICTKTDEKGCLHALERQLYQLVRSQGRRQQHTERECLSVATKHNNKPVFFWREICRFEFGGLLVAHSHTCGISQTSLRHDVLAADCK